MGNIAFIVDSSPHRLWGVTLHDRIVRQLNRINIRNFATSIDDINDDDEALLINANYLFEVRTLTDLLQRSSGLLQCPDDAGIAAAHVPGAQARDVVDIVAHTSPADPIEIDIVEPGSSQDFDADLRKVDPPMLKLVTKENLEELESLLYGNSYKGITDLVTKWLWPLPARLLVMLCTKSGISPNMVTTAGLVLVVAASFLFLNGHYADFMVSIGNLGSVQVKRILIVHIKGLDTININFKTILVGGTVCFHF